MMATSSSIEVVTDIMNQEKCEEMLLNKVSTLEKELQEKNEDLLGLEGLTNSLIVQERMLTDELVDVRKVLLEELNSSFSNTDFLSLGFGIKRMGELDANAFVEKCKLKFPPEEYKYEALKLCSFWDEKLRDSLWFPVKVVEDGKGKFQEVMKEDDELLMDLKNEWGEDCYNAVVTAFKELNEYNPSYRSPVLEFWNLQENRKASPGEVISSIFKQMKVLKKKAKGVPTGAGMMMMMTMTMTMTMMMMVYKRIRDI